MRGRCHMPHPWANRQARESQPITTELPSYGGVALGRNRDVIGHWAVWGRVQGAWPETPLPPGVAGRGGGPRSRRRRDGGDTGAGCSCGSSADNDGRGAIGRRLLGALVPQGAAASRQPGAAGCRARGALCALRLHPRPLVRGFFFGGDQSVEVRTSPGFGGRSLTSGVTADA